MTDDSHPHVALVCARCASRLVPILGAWGKGRARGTRAFRCPRLSACGFGGIAEDGDAALRFRLGLPPLSADVRLA